MFPHLALLSLVAVAMALPQGLQPTPVARQIKPTFAIEDGKLSAGLILNTGVGSSDGALVTGYLSLGGDINKSNFLEGGVQEMDTEVIPIPFLATLTM